MKLKADLPSLYCYCTYSTVPYVGIRALGDAVYFPVRSWKKDNYRFLMCA